VKAFVFLQLCSFRLVTGQTRSGNVLGQFQDQGGMGIRVAVEAIVQLEVGTAAVAFAAGGNDLPDFGRMSLVTVHAAYFGFMGTSLGGDVPGCFLVTFNAVSVAQLITGLSHRYK